MIPPSLLCKYHLFLTHISYTKFHLHVEDARNPFIHLKHFNRETDKVFCGIGYLALKVKFIGYLHF